MNEKIQLFAELVARETRERYEKFFTSPDPLVKEALVATNSRVSVVPGKKYTKVDVGGSGKYMVDNETGEIFGIKGYGKIHKGHRYGTLDTIKDWYWGGYVAVEMPF